VSFNVSRWRPAPLAPRTTGWGLWLAVMILTLIGAIVSILGAAGARAVLDRRADWDGSITIAAMERGLETADAAAARAEELLRRQTGVASVEVRDPRRDDAVIAGLMGATTSGVEAPRFIDVRPVPGARLSQADLAAPLAAQGLAVRFDDHRRWDGPVERTALAAGGGWAALTVAAVALLAGCVLNVAGHAVRRVRKRMSLMISLGATRGMLAAQFPGPLCASAVVGALIGSVLAAGLALWAAELLFRSQAAAIGFDRWDLLAAAPWPPAAALIGWLFARLGAAGALKRVL